MGAWPPLIISCDRVICCGHLGAVDIRARRFLGLLPCLEQLSISQQPLAEELAGGAELPLTHQRLHSQNAAGRFPAPPSPQPRDGSRAALRSREASDGLSSFYSCFFRLQTSHSDVFSACMSALPLLLWFCCCVTAKVPKQHRYQMRNPTTMWRASDRHHAGVLLSVNAEAGGPPGARCRVCLGGRGTGARLSGTLRPAAASGGKRRGGASAPSPVCRP